MDKLPAVARRIYQPLSAMVRSASMMTTFCVQFKARAAASKSGVLPYIRWKSRIRRRFRGEKPVASVACAVRYSAAATAAPFSVRSQMILPIRWYSSICGRPAATAALKAANMAL